MLLYNFGEKISKSHFFKYRKMTMSFFQPKKIFKFFFLSDTTQNAKFSGLGCFSTTLVPDPLPYRKIFFLFFLADSENIYLSYVLRKKNFFSVLSTTFLKYRKKSMSNFKKKFFFIGDQNKHDFYRFGMFLYNFGKKNFFEKISKSNFFKYRKMAMSIFQSKIFFQKIFFSQIPLKM